MAEYKWTPDIAFDQTMGQAALLMTKALKRRAEERAQLAVIMRLAVNAGQKDFKKMMENLTGRKPPKLDPEKLKEFLE